MPIKQALWLGAGGLVTAALYLSVLAGPAFFLLQYLTQLPLLCVGLAFGLFSLVATSLISVLFTVVADPGLTIVFVLGYIGPVLFIVHRFLCVGSWQQGKRSGTRRAGFWRG